MQSFPEAPAGGKTSGNSFKSNWLLYQAILIFDSN